MLPRPTKSNSLRWDPNSNNSESSPRGLQHAAYFDKQCFKLPFIFCLPTWPPPLSPASSLLTLSWVLWGAGQAPKAFSWPGDVSPVTTLPWLNSELIWLDTGGTFVLSRWTAEACGRPGCQNGATRPRFHLLPCARRPMWHAWPLALISRPRWAGKDINSVGARPPPECSRAWPEFPGFPFSPCLRSCFPSRSAVCSWQTRHVSWPELGDLGKFEGGWQDEKH